MRFLNTKLAVLMLIGTVFFASCGGEEQAVVPPPEIPVVKVFEHDVPIYNEFIGEVYGEKDIPIRARVEGYLEGIHFNEGSEISKGQLLYSIDPKPFEAKVNAQQSEVAAAKTIMVKAKSDLDRYKPLAELNAVSQSDLDAAQANYDASVSGVEAAKANLRSAMIELGYCKIYSPIKGIIGISKAREGDFVGRDPNPVILNTVSETHNIKVRFYLTESDYLFLSREVVARTGEIDGNRQDNERKATVEILLSDGSTYEHKGSIDFIDRGIDPTTGSILLQATFPNPDLILRPGLYAKVRVSARRAEGAIIIPQRCLMELQGLFSVYTITDSNTVASMHVTLGPPWGDYRIITEGLQGDEIIVIDALQKVREGMTVVPDIIDFESKTNTQLN